MVRPEAVAALGAEGMAKVCELSEEQMAAAAEECEAERVAELERQKSMGTLMLGVALASFYFMWLQGIVPPHSTGPRSACRALVEDLSAALGLAKGRPAEP
ncbi:hypothetical protein JL720_12878 [Aureococcus anophagefferens]|nr:hypothetical protein JL720_12878 [Aureococcus anophagefferens]